MVPPLGIKHSWDYHRSGKYCKNFSFATIAVKFLFNQYTIY